MTDWRKIVPDAEIDRERHLKPKRASSRGLRGGTYGAANKGKHLSKDAIRAIEERLRKEDKIS